jgi:uncharacterized protein (DUF885 family)
MIASPGSAVAGSARLAALAERVWQHRLAREPLLRCRVGLEVDRIPTWALDEAEGDARLATDLSPELRALHSDRLTHEDSLTLQFLRDELDYMSKATELWWCQFPVTPYTAMNFGALPRLVFESFEFKEPDAGDRYLALIRDFAKLLQSVRGRLADQAQRGWLIPKPALPGVRATVTQLGGLATSSLRPNPARVSRLRDRGTGLVRAVDTLVNTDIRAAFQQLLEALGSEYEQRAPEKVGLSQYPGGESAYRMLVRHHATYAVDPERVHELGIQEVRRLSEEMQGVRTNLGFPSGENEFTAHLRASGRLYARNPEDVEARYRHHMARMAAVVERYFISRPKAPYEVARLDREMESGLSYGFYELPTAANPVGRYRYNGSGLEARSQLSAAALIFHELVPGHHFHLARQAENEGLPAIRRQAFGISAFNEGWAEYASDLARELNLYDDPYDLYGRLLQERFGAQRLVVDTGLNLLGWTLEQGRAYMRAATLESELQIASETLRYSTDLPGQSLSYRLGMLKFCALRAKAERELGSAFDIRRFHEAILGAGALPLDVLEGHIEWFIAQERNRSAC